MSIKNSAIQGGILVALGASCYGVLTTFVKLAYQEGFTTYEVTFAQLLLGFVGVLVLNLFLKSKKNTTRATPKNKLHLILAGTSLGLTSIFYYLSVQYISVSVGIVLLMQSVWMGVVLDALLTKTFPSRLKCLAVVLIIAGTLLATNVLFQEVELNAIGIAWGLLAAASYTVTVYTSNRVAPQLTALKRTQWMLVGGLAIVSLITAPELLQDFNLAIFKKWGPILALLGAVLPPILLTSGMPKVNVGVGVIITAIELPVAVCMAFLILNEQVTAFQWLGILIILCSIVLMNLRKVKKG